MPGCNLYANQTPTEWFNYQCFTASTYGTVGNLGRNVMRGPGYAETDISVTKNTRINEKVTLQFKAEMFNIFNHPNFAVPDGGIINAGQTPNDYNYNPITQGPAATSYNPVGAQITSLIGSGGLPGVARQTQFSLKLLF